MHSFILHAGAGWTATGRRWLVQPSPVSSLSHSCLFLRDYTPYGFPLSPRQGHTNELLVQFKSSVQQKIKSIRRELGPDSPPLHDPPPRTRPPFCPILLRSDLSTIQSSRCPNRPLSHYSWKVGRAGRTRERSKGLNDGLMIVVA